jgi:hypothetical protein
MTENRIATRKFLVALGSRSSDFLIPIATDDGILLFGIKSKKLFEQGQMVYIGREITAGDVLERLIASGRTIEGEESTLKMLNEYLRMLQDYKIGNILSLQDSAQSEYGFQLVKIADHEPFEIKNLP